MLHLYHMLGIHYGIHFKILCMLKIMFTSPLNVVHQPTMYFYIDNCHKIFSKLVVLKRKTRIKLEYTWRFSYEVYNIVIRVKISQERSFLLHYLLHGLIPVSRVFVSPLVISVDTVETSVTDRLVMLMDSS